MTQKQAANGQWNQAHLTLEDTEAMTERAIETLERFPDDATL